MSAASEPALADSATRWADLRLRVISAAILAPLALLCVWAGGLLYWLMLLAGFTGVTWEWGSMCRWRPVPLWLGLVYVALAFASLVLLRLYGASAVFFVLVVVWSSDIGAYAVGRLIGGPRLAPSISPGKTWSGAAGGLAASIVLGGFMAGFTVGNLVVAALLGAVSQLGDLGESALKRRYGVKDSGHLIPGHGGLLDRLDGLMAASLVAGILFVSFILLQAGSPAL